MNDCLSPRLDADMLSITETSSEKGDDALCFWQIFSLWFLNNVWLYLQRNPIDGVALVINKHTNLYAPYSIYIFGVFKHNS